MAKIKRKVKRTSGTSMKSNQLSKLKVGLAVGYFVALFHIIWAILVGTGTSQKLIDWAMPLHFIDMSYSMIAFNWTTAIILIVLAFVVSFIMGWLFALIYNKVNSY